MTRNGEESAVSGVAEPVYETRVLGRVGDWLVVPVIPPGERLHRWGRITGVIPGEGPVRYRVRWMGDDHDSVVLPPEFSRIEREEDWTEAGPGQLRRWPN